MFNILDTKKKHFLWELLQNKASYPQFCSEDCIHRIHFTFAASGCALNMHLWPTRETKKRTSRGPRGLIYGITAQTACHTCCYLILLKLKLRIENTFCMQKTNIIWLCNANTCFSLLQVTWCNLNKCRSGLLPWACQHRPLKWRGEPEDRHLEPCRDDEGWSRAAQRFARQLGALPGSNTATLHDVSFDGTECILVASAVAIIEINSLLFWKSIIVPLGIAT